MQKYAPAKLAWLFARAALASNGMADAIKKPASQDFDCANISGLSEELRGKLLRFKPATLGQAGRIQGITPRALSLLQPHIKSHHAKVRAG